MRIDTSISSGQTRWSSRALASFTSAVSKPSVNQPVDRRQYLARLDALALITPQSGKAGCSTKLERLGVLATRDRQRPLEWHSVSLVEASRRHRNSPRSRGATNPLLFNCLSRLNLLIH